MNEKTPKSRSWMLKNSRGRPDGLLTFAVWATAVVLVKFLFHGVSFVLEGKTFTFGTIDGLLVGAILGPTLGAYTWKRVKGAKDEPGTPPAAGFVAPWVLVTIVGVAVLGLVALALYASVFWGLVLLAVLTGVGFGVVAVFAGSDPEGRSAALAGWSICLCLALAGGGLAAALGRGLWALVRWAGGAS